MEWNDVAKRPEESKEFRDKEAIFAPVMSPSWSKASQKRQKELEKSKSKTGEESLKDKISGKLKKIF